MIATGMQTELGRIAFTTLTLSQMALALACRAERDSLLRRGRRGNPALLWAVLVTVGLQLAVVYLPFLQNLFHTTALSLEELLLSAGLSTLVFWALEAAKWLRRRGDHTASPAAAARPDLSKGSLGHA